MARPMDEHDVPIRQQLRGGHGSFRSMAVDITKEFAQAARSLANGRVASARDFRLFDAVGAIEIGDPKMDSGLLLPSDVYKPIYDITRPLSWLELTYVFDIHIFYLMDWHKGMPLAQTLLASHYIDALLQHSTRTIEFFEGNHQRWLSRSDESLSIEDELHSLALTFICLGIAKLCGFAMDELKHSDAPFYEDEDISLHTMGRDFFPLVTHTGLWTLGQRVQDMIDELMARPAIKDQEKQTGMLKAISQRIMLLMAMIGVMDSSLPNRRRYERTTIAIACRDRIIEMQAIMPGQRVMGVFSPLLQHRSASTCPLRPLNEYDFSKAYGDLQSLILGVQLEWPAAVVVTNSESPFLLKRFLRNFSARSTLALPYVRAAVYSTFLSETMKEMEFYQFLDMAEFMPIEIFSRYWSDDQPRLPREAVETMFSYSRDFVQKFYAQYYRALCSNASRMRRLLCRSLYAITRLNGMALQMDEYLISVVNSGMMQPVTLWCTFMKFDIMQDIVELGFELGLYLEHELQPMYRFLLQIMSGRADAIEAVIEEMTVDEDEELGSFDRKAFDRLNAYQKMRDGDLVLTMAVNLMHMVAIKLDPKPSSLPAIVQQRRWEIRMRPFWQAGIRTDAWDRLEQQHILRHGRLIRAFNNNMPVVAAISDCISLFQEALRLYAYNRLHTDATLMMRSLEDENYRQKQSLANMAIEELRRWIQAWNNREPMSIDRTKISVQRQYGNRLVYLIPGLIKRSADETMTAA